MPPPSNNPKDSWNPRDLETPAPKLDPRLRYLLSLPFDTLEELQRRERDALRVLQGKIRIELDAFRTSQTSTERAHHAENLRKLYGERFTPLTSGLHIPDPVAGTGRWARGIDEIFFSAFILSDTNTVGLERHGVRVRCQSGDVFTAFVPRSSLESLEHSAAVRGMELARPLFPSLDWTIPFTQIQDLHKRPAPIDGRGVIVGVVDDSIDIYHPTFQKPGLGGVGIESRLLFLWDQNATPRANESPVAVDMPLPGFVISNVANSGVEYPARSTVAGRHTINGQLVPGTVRGSIVTHDARAAGQPHGTEVTGCAAGNGELSGGACTGAAPGADIIFVAYKEESGSGLLAENTAVMDGCDYIFRRAKQLGQPCVINLSLSDNLGPHDGTAGCERFLDGLLSAEPGRVVTVCAGNSNDKNAHASGTVTPGSTETRDLRFNPVMGPPSTGLNNDQVQIWYTAGSTLEVTVLVAGVTKINALVPTVGGNPHEAVLPGGAHLTVDSKLNCAWNNDNLISLLIEVDATGRIDDLRIILKNTSASVATFHAWVDRNNEYVSGSGWASPVPDTGTLGSPATAKFLIAVGSHRKIDPPAIPTIAPYSGCGPTRGIGAASGRQKPEIATAGGLYTGEATRETLMNVPIPSNPSVVPAAGNLYFQWEEGTSFAAPVVAGACALLFQCRAGAGGTADVLQDLVDSAGAAGPVDAFGNGYLQMATACSCAEETSGPLWAGLDEDDLSVMQDLPVMPPPFGDTWWGSPDVGVLIDERRFRDNPIVIPSPHSGYRVQVTVRNVSRKEIRDVEVDFYWADLATGLISLSDWSRKGVFVPGQGGKPAQGNRIVLERIPAKCETHVEFLWKAPESRGDPRKSGSFSFLARILHPSMVAARRKRDRSTVGIRDAVALRSVVVGKLGASRKSSMDFLVAGSEDPSSLYVAAQGAKGDLTLRLPIEALPWRDLDFLERSETRRSAYGAEGRPDPLAKVEMSLVDEDIGMVTGVVGAERLVLADGFATLVVKAGERLQIPDLRVAPGARMPVRVEIRNAKLAGRRGFVHVAQFAQGRAAGGVSLELRKVASRRGSER